MLERERFAVQPTFNVEPAVLLHFPQSDHGLHALRATLSSTEFQDVLSWMNRIRRKLGSKEKITMDQILDKEAKCKFCRYPRRPGLSPASICYGPPSFGKATVMDRENFVGFDTDLIGIGLKWSSYSILLLRDIPIVTNQPETFVGSGLKIYGAMSHNIRLNKYGIPYTTVEAQMDFARRIREM